MGLPPLHPGSALMRRNSSADSLLLPPGVGRQGRCMRVFDRTHTVKKKGLLRTRHPKDSPPTPLPTPDTRNSDGGRPGSERSDNCNELLGALPHDVFLELTSHLGPGDCARCLRCVRVGEQQRGKKREEGIATCYLHTFSPVRTSISITHRPVLIPLMIQRLLGLVGALWGRRPLGPLPPPALQPPGHLHPRSC